MNDTRLIDEETPAKHLWEVDHPYYCSDSNYYSNDCYRRFKTWAEFFEEFGNCDFDYNLPFRWDWNEGSDHELPDYSGDDYYRNGLLQISWMGQRKGLYFVSAIEVCRADEAEVIKFLKPRWEHMRQLWEPIA